MLGSSGKGHPAASNTSSPWPTEISLSPDKAVLTIHFDDGQVFALAAELLRVESPSAEIKGHGTGQKITPEGKRYVTIRNVEPVGHYAVRLNFSDGHDTGIFTWDVLYSYGANANSLMAAYLKRLDDAELSRGD
jgi:DUF971 family protein